MAEAMRAQVASMLKGIDRYNPANLTILEKYVQMQIKDNLYDLEANLSILKLYQFNNSAFKLDTVVQILLKALTNLPHTDFILCKCLLDQTAFDEEKIIKVMGFHNMLETCQFRRFWQQIVENKEYVSSIVGFSDSIRKFICHVVNITYQRIEKPVLLEILGGLTEIDLRMWMNKYGWKDIEDNLVYIANQEENVKTKNITEKIDFESVAAIMATSR